MKVISEYTIKKLIQAKLLENYKKKLLKEEDNSINETDFKNQIISTGLIEALYVFLNDSAYTSDLGNILTFKPILNLQLEAILKSQNKSDFINKISKLPSDLSTVLTSNQDLLKETLFTKLIANSDLILKEFESEIETIKGSGAYNLVGGDLYVIENHLTDGVTYKVPISGIKAKIKNMISELLKTQSQNITVNQVISKIKTLLPVLDANGSTNTTTTTTDSTAQQNTKSQEIKKVGFAELKDKLNLSQRQLQKLNRKITATANRRTNSLENSQKYQALLVALTLKQMSGDKMNINNNNIAADTTSVVITTLKIEQQKFKDCYIAVKKWLDDDTSRTQEETNKIMYKWLTYVISNDKIKYNDYSFQPENIRDEFINHLTLQTEQILIGSEIFKLSPTIQAQAKDFFRKINSTSVQDVQDDNLQPKFKQFQEWLDTYFGRNESIEEKKLILNYTFINYIQLNFLAYEANIKTAQDVLKEFKLPLVKTEELSGEVITSKNAKATTKKCFRENDTHTDNFKLPALGVLKKNYYQQMAEYLLEPDFPSNAGFGFINKSNVEKNIYVQKLKDANLNADKIAKALKTLYPKAGDFKTKGNKERWIANCFLNINADEIITAANGVSTSDTVTETEVDTAPTKDCLLRDNGNEYNFKLLSKDKMQKLINKHNPTADDYREVMAKLLLDLDNVPTDYGFKETDKIKFKKALGTANPKLTVDQIKKALAEIYPNSNTAKSQERWYPEYYININPHEIIRVAKKP